MSTPKENDDEQFYEDESEFKKHLQLIKTATAELYFCAELETYANHPPEERLKLLKARTEKFRAANLKLQMEEDARKVVEKLAALNEAKQVEATSSKQVNKSGSGDIKKKESDDEKKQVAEISDKAKQLSLKDRKKAAKEANIKLEAENAAKKAALKARMSEKPKTNDPSAEKNNEKLEKVAVVVENTEKVAVVVENTENVAVVVENTETDVNDGQLGNGVETEEQHIDVNQTNGSVDKKSDGDVVKEEADEIDAVNAGAIAVEERGDVNDGQLGHGVKKEVQGVDVVKRSEDEQVEQKIDGDNKRVESDEHQMDEKDVIGDVVEKRSGAADEKMENGEPTTVDGLESVKATEEAQKTNDEKKVDEKASGVDEKNHGEVDQNLVEAVDTTTVEQLNIKTDGEENANETAENIVGDKKVDVDVVKEEADEIDAEIAGTIAVETSGDVNDSQLGHGVEKEVQGVDVVYGSEDKQVEQKIDGDNKSVESVEQKMDKKDILGDDVEKKSGAGDKKVEATSSKQVSKSGAGDIKKKEIDDEKKRVAQISETVKKMSWKDRKNAAKEANIKLEAENAAKKAALKARKSENPKTNDTSAEKRNEKLEKVAVVVENTETDVNDGQLGNGVETEEQRVVAIKGSEYKEDEQMITDDKKNDESVEHEIDETTILGDGVEMKSGGGDSEKLENGEPVSVDGLESVKASEEAEKVNDEKKVDGDIVDEKASDVEEKNHGESDQNAVPSVSDNRLNIKTDEEKEANETAEKSSSDEKVGAGVVREDDGFDAAWKIHYWP